MAGLLTMDCGEGKRKSGFVPVFVLLQFLTVSYMFCMLYRCGALCESLPPSQQARFLPVDRTQSSGGGDGSSSSSSGGSSSSSGGSSSSSGGSSNDEEVFSGNNKISKEKESPAVMQHNRQVRHERDHHHHQRRHASTTITTASSSSSTTTTSVPENHKDESVEEGPAQDSPHFNNTYNSSGNSSENGTSVFKVESQEPYFPNGFWIRVAQAKVLAFAVENGILPRLDESSQIMKPAGCRKEDDKKCHEFTFMCAEKMGDELVKKLHSEGNPSHREDVPEYMRYIWRECGMKTSYNSTSHDDDNDKNQLPPPMAKFHCNTRKGEEVTESNFRMEYPWDKQELLMATGLPVNISNGMIPRYFVLEVGNGKGMWQLPSKPVQAFWLFRFKTKTSEQIQIRVTAVSPKYVYPPVTSPLIRIYSAGQLTVNQPVNLEVVSISVDKFAARPSPSALVRWQSGSGLNASCDYDVFYMYDDLMKVERKKADDAFWVKLDNLHFAQNYSVKVLEKFGGGLEANVESSLYVPTCLELRGFSFELCPPPPPTGVRMFNATEHSFWIEWNPPKYLNSTNRIIHYNLTVDWIYTPTATSSTVVADGFIHTSNAPSISSVGQPSASTSARAQFNTQKIFGGNVPGNVTIIEIRNVTQYRGQFKISVTAVGAAGPSESSWDVVSYKGPPVSDWTTRKILTLFFALFGVVLLIALFCVLKHLHEKRQRNKKRQQKFEDYEKDSLQLNQIYKDRDATKWEIESCNLTLGDAIGQGNFGLVRRATLNHRGKKMVVAVKTLRDVVNEHYVEKLWEEYEILKNLDPHKHVVGLKGIVTKHVPLPLLVVEYCDGGDLQSHLRKLYKLASCCRRYSPQGSTPTSGSSSCTNFSNSENRTNSIRVVQNAAYFLRNEAEASSPTASPTPPPAPTPPLTIVDLLSYARQVACGMEYLSSNKIVHRDLAARNILISGKTRILKVSDFGLSRDVYEQNWYKKKSNEDVPIKWLAIESILNEIYTTKSDVWSFGILLWEILTYGGNPYPGVVNSRVFELLKEGYRMPRPDNCSADLYKLMRLCWKDYSDERPDFTGIRLILEDIIEKTSQVTYLNLESSVNNKANPNSMSTGNSAYFYKNCGDSGFEEYGGSLNGSVGMEPKLPPRNKKKFG